jgi:hypothetical protein
VGVWPAFWPIRQTDRPLHLKYFAQHIGTKAMKNLSIAFVVVLILFTTSCVHVGARLLHVQIEVDGVTTLEGIRGVPDNMPVEEMWDVLTKVPFQPTGGATATPDSADAKTWSLSGTIVVRIKHVDRVLASATLTSLSLNKDMSGTAWSLPRNEVSRIKQARTNK